MKIKERPLVFTQSSIWQLRVWSSISHIQPNAFLTFCKLYFSDTVMCISLNSENRAFPQYGKLACALTDKIAAWRWSSNPGINHKALLLLYPVAARAANLHSGTPGPIDRSAAAHPLPPTPARVQKVKFLPRPEGGEGGFRGSRGRAEAQLRKHALTVGQRLIPPTVTCAKRPPVFSPTHHSSYFPRNFASFF